MNTKSRTNLPPRRYALFEEETVTREFFKQTIVRRRPSFRLVAESAYAADIVTMITSSRPDFIITSIYLCDGTSLEELKRMESRLPIIICTAYEEALPAARGLNVVLSTLKPVTEEDVIQIIKAIDDNFQIVNTTRNPEFSVAL